MDTLRNLNDQLRDLQNRREDLREEKNTLEADIKQIRRKMKDLAESNPDYIGYRLELDRHDKNLLIIERDIGSRELQMDSIQQRIGFIEEQNKIANDERIRRDVEEKRLREVEESKRKKEEKRRWSIGITLTIIAILIALGTWLYPDIRKLVVSWISPAQVMPPPVVPKSIVDIRPMDKILEDLPTGTMNDGHLTESLLLEQLDRDKSKNLIRDLLKTKQLNAQASADNKNVLAIGVSAPFITVPPDDSEESPTKLVGSLFARSAQQILQGVTYAVDESNETEEIKLKDGKPISLIVYPLNDASIAPNIGKNDKVGWDNYIKESEESAKNVAKKFVSTPDVVGVVGSYRTETLFAIKDTYNKGRLPIIAPTATSSLLNEELAKTNENPFVYRVAPDTKRQVEKLANLILDADKQNMTIFLADEDDKYLSALATDLAEKLKNYYPKTINKARWQTLSIPKFDKNSALFVAGYDFDVVAIVCQIAFLKDQKNQEINIPKLYSGNAAYTSLIKEVYSNGCANKANGKYINGIVVSSFTFTTSNVTSTTTSPFVSGFEKRYGDKSRPNPTVIQSYDATRLFIEALKEVLKKKDAFDPKNPVGLREEINTALAFFASTGNLLPTDTGLSLGFNQNSHNVTSGRDYVITQFCDGDFVLLDKSKKC